MSAVVTQPLTCHEALRIAHEDASRVYDDLSDCDILVRLMSDGWHVDYEIRDPVNGGAPHYRIDPLTGEILWKRYYQ